MCIWNVLFLHKWQQNSPLWVFEFNFNPMDELKTLRQVRLRKWDMFCTSLQHAVHIRSNISDPGKFKIVYSNIGVLTLFCVKISPKLQMLAWREVNCYFLVFNSSVKTLLQLVTTMFSKSVKEQHISNPLLDY